MGKRKQKQAENGPCLPSEAAAWWFVCQCFGIELKELNEELECLRRRKHALEKMQTAEMGDWKEQAEKQRLRELKEIGELPAQFHAESVKRAIQGSNRWTGLMVRLCRDLVLKHVHREGEVFRYSAERDRITELVDVLISVYGEVAPLIMARNVDRRVAMMVIMEEVLLPTAFLWLWARFREGLGTELRGAECWYLASESKQGKMTPIRRVLDCWLRSAGFRTAYGVSKKMGDDPDYRRKVDRWLNGKVVPKDEALHELVEKFPKAVEWLDTADQWKQRFTLACAMQRLWDQVDEYFKVLTKGASLRISEKIGEIEAEQVPIDGKGVLGSKSTFFAARLLKRRLVREGRWESEVLSQIVTGSWPFPPEATAAEITRVRAEIHSGGNVGNCFLMAIKELAEPRRRKLGLPLIKYDMEEDIFQLGIEEVNSILHEKGAGGRDAHRP